MPLCRGTHCRIFMVSNLKHELAWLLLTFAIVRQRKTIAAPYLSRRSVIVVLLITVSSGCASVADTNSTTEGGQALTECVQWFKNQQEKRAQKRWDEILPKGPLISFSLPDNITDNTILFGTFAAAEEDEGIDSTRLDEFRSNPNNKKLIEQLAIGFDTAQSTTVTEVLLDDWSNDDVILLLVSATVFANEIHNHPDIVLGATRLSQSQVKIQSVPFYDFLHPSRDFPRAFAISHLGAVDHWSLDIALQKITSETAMIRGVRLPDDPDFRAWGDDAFVPPLLVRPTLISRTVWPAPGTTVRVALTDANGLPFSIILPVPNFEGA